MWWIWLERVGAALVTFKVARELVNPRTRKIDENTVYSEKTAARLLGTDPEHVTELIECGHIKARRVGSDYRILGKSLIEFLKETERS